MHGGIMSRQLILLIQQELADATGVQEVLNKSIDHAFRVDWVRTCNEALERLTGKESETQDRIAAILVDLFLLDCEGIETFDRLFHAAPQIPILILTASEHEGIAKLAVQRGAQDYFVRTRLDSYL